MNRRKSSKKTFFFAMKTNTNWRDSSAIAEIIQPNCDHQQTEREKKKDGWSSNTQHRKAKNRFNCFWMFHSKCKWNSWPHDASKKYMRFSNKCEVVIKIWGFFVSFQVIVGGFAGFRINEYLLFDGAFHENGIFHLTTQFDWNRPHWTQSFACSPNNVSTALFLSVLIWWYPFNICNTDVTTTGNYNLASAHTT